jgi:MFS family permease
MLASAAAGFALARFALGIGEAGNFPAAIKTVAEWFPRKERALATGIFNSGSNVGALVTPLVVPWIALRWGWQSAFIATGALGFLWVACWCGFTIRRRSIRAFPLQSSHILEAIRWKLRSNSVGPIAPASADVGVRDRQIHDGPHLVAVSLLGAGFPESQSRAGPQINGSAAGGHLPGR